MLQSLYLKNIAIFDEMGVSFEPGFNVLTGETGAGKSVLIDAVNLILGGKASRELIRNGEKSALVSAVFSLDAALAKALERDYPQAQAGELEVSREMTAEGRSICKIGARPVTVSALREVGLRLINIHGQSDNQSLYRKEVHIDYLDRFCTFGGAMESYRKLYDTYRGLIQEVRALETETDQQEQRAQELSDASEELAAAELTEGEEETLREKKRRYQNSEKMQKAVYAAYAMLYEMPEGGSVYDLAKGAQRELSAVANDSTVAQELCQRLEELSVLARDLAEETRTLSEGSELSPAELEQLEERLDLISRLKRKYGKDVPALLRYQQEVDEELFTLLHRDRALEQKKQELRACETKLAGWAQKISACRKRAADTLESAIAQELKELDMPSVRFRIRLETTQDASGGLRLMENGADQVEFLIAPNAGEGLLPISKIASGGEMARIMLAIKSVMAQVESVDTLIFDEIDTGVSGRAAQKIAQKMFVLSKQKQVMAVTHLPQIASMADFHYRISKQTADGRTSAQISPLAQAGRVQEIARMTGGVEITETTVENAEEMLALAEEYRRTFL